MKLIFTLFFVLLSTASFAQHPAAHWYLGGNSDLDFTITPATLRLKSTGTTNQATTFSDSTGRVAFYVNETGIFSRSGQQMPNGTLALRDFSNPTIYLIRKPGSTTQCYVFYAGFVNFANSTFGGLYYALVDMAANGGAGAVLQKDQLIEPNLHRSFTISGQCADGDYWLVGGYGTTVAGSEKIIAHRITASGIANQVTESVPVPAHWSYGYKLSPTSNWLVYNYQNANNPAPLGSVLCRFDVNTGQVTRVATLSTNFKSYAGTTSNWRPEFSASGHKLYLMKADTLIQFDVSSPSATTILGSCRLIYGSNGPTFNFQQLGPDGRIYSSNDANTALSVIQSPELSGQACDLQLNLYPGPGWSPFLPSIASHLLYRSPLQPDAGPDRTVCMGEPVGLGGAAMPVAYNWSPATYLTSTTSATPTFRYTGPAVTVPTDLWYTVAVNDGNCTLRDRIRVTVQPTPATPIISGSRSVCPGIQGVEYAVAAQPGLTYRWQVTGGTLVSGQGTAKVTVNWGPRIPQATVQVVASNSSGCTNSATLPVRINPALQTETPTGETPICLNQQDGVAYTVTKTTGSVYTWGIRGGKVMTGQGSSRITVNWTGLGQHRLWVQEQAVADTICYGVSDTLRVNVFQDPTMLNLSAVSIGPGSDNEATISWALSQPLTHNQRITVLRRTAGSSAWQEAAQVPATLASYTDQGVAADDYSYEYLLRTRNNCDEPLETTLHRSIHLTGLARPADDKLDLNWNAYTGWPAADTHYELWRKVDKEEAYTLLRPLSNSSFSASDLDALAGFEHHYKIRANNTKNALVVWSNEVELSFEHALVIANIFTPNGDKRNDTFRIPKLELYPENELTIFNRYGKQVFQQKNYTGNWSGSDLGNGVYYYQLFLKRLNTYHKGWGQIAK